MSSNLGEDDILSLTTWRLLAHEEEVQWESHVEGICVVDLLDVLLGQLQREGGDIAFQVIDIATSDDWEDIWGLVENISKTISMGQCSACRLRLLLCKLTQPMSRLCSSLWQSVPEPC